MKPRITSSSLFTRHFLIVTEAGVKFSESSLFTAVRRFRFDQIVCVLLSPDNVLSFQVGEEVFSIPVKPGKAKHQAAIDALLQGLQGPQPAAPLATLIS